MSIRRYYDQNTRLFLALGSSRQAPTIHRAVWAPGVPTLPAALNYTHTRLLQALHPLQSDCLRVGDLGCGVGASLFYLLGQVARPAWALGLTLSGVQAALAHQAQRRHPPPQPCHFVQGDFQAVPAPAAAFDFIYSIEAYCHAPQPAHYWAEVARLLRPGGRLALCDDFRAERAWNHADARWFAAYQHGWHVPNVHAFSVTLKQAEAVGLRVLEQEDWTPHLRLRALPEALARPVLTVGQRLPQGHAIVPSMVGSLALQQCLKRGLVRYQWVVFEKPVTSHQ